MDPYDLPEEFSHLQALDMSKLGFMQDLIHGVTKIVRFDVQKENIKELANKANNNNVDIAPLLKRVFMFLEDGQWGQADKYSEKVLDRDPENVQAYLGKLMARLHVKEQEELRNCKEPFDSTNEYKKIMRYGDNIFIDRMKWYIEYIKRNKNDRLLSIYNSAVNAMWSAKTVDEYISVSETLKVISGFKDSNELITDCKKKIEELNKKAKRKRKVLRILGPLVFAVLIIVCLVKFPQYQTHIFILSFIIVILLAIISKVER